MNLDHERTGVGKGMTWAAASLLAWLCLHQSVLAVDPLPYPRVHRMAGGATQVFANAYIIEGERGVVVVDALLTRSGSARLRERVDAIGKPLLAVLLTHGHPDHYGGATGLVAGRPQVPIVALKGVDAVIRRDDAAKGQALKALDIDWAETRTFPNVIVADGVGLTFADIEVRALDLGEGESDHDSLWILHAGDGEHAFVGDQVMQGVHAYTADGHTGPWLESLERLESKLRDAVRLYPGHGMPGGVELIGRQIAYLERFRIEVQEVSKARTGLTDDQVEDLERRMIEYLGHDRMSRWILEGAGAVAEELAAPGGP